MKKIFWKRLNLLMKIIAYPFLGEWVGNDDIPTKIDAMSKGKKIYVSTSFPNPVQNTTVFQKNREYERQTQKICKNCSGSNFLFILVNILPAVSFTTKLGLVKNSMNLQE